MKFYFAGSIRGGRHDQELYLDIIKLLGKYGEVLTEHIGDKLLSSMGEDGPTDDFIYARDMAWLKEADVVIAEVTTPSLGVGYEIGNMDGKKPILCIYREQDGKKLSAMLSGSKGLGCVKYRELSELEIIFEDFFKKKFEAKFIPKPGQVDFTHSRYAPVINCIVRYKDKVLIVERSAEMRLYPNFWNGISGFLDDNRSIEEKVKDELNEELGIAASDITEIFRGQIFNQEEEKYSKTWIVHPILIDVKTDQIKLNWEAQNYKWIRVEEIHNFNLLPGVDQVFATLFPSNRN